jgi:hypothetical protein
LRSFILKNQGPGPMVRSIPVLSGSVFGLFAVR